jgi:hypothetical protein
LNEWSFSGCSSLITIQLPSTIESIGNECFGWCNSLRSINFPSSLQTVGEDYFKNCDNLPEKIKNKFSKLKKITLKTQ